MGSNPTPSATRSAGQRPIPERIGWPAARAPQEVLNACRWGGMALEDTDPTRPGDPGGSPTGTVRDRVDDPGAGIDDLRTHLVHAHPMRPEWVAELASADLAALHRRLHGRAVDPDPELVDAHLLEVRTDPDGPATTSLGLQDAVDGPSRGRPLAWLPLRVADLVHHADAPGHQGRGGCRACSDVVDAVIRALRELDRTPQARIAELEHDLGGAAHALTQARSLLFGLLAEHGPAEGDVTWPTPPALALLQGFGALEEALARLAVLDLPGPPPGGCATP